MLHKNPFIIAPETFELIQNLQKMDILKNFHLVGGTALALQIGHRNSIDIDLFTIDDFDDNEIMVEMNSSFIVNERFKRNNTIICLLNNIKTDFIRHNYPLIRPPIVEDGIRFLGKEDIAAMKFHAIIQSGKRLKDFIDIYFLLNHFSMNQMLDFFIQKYNYMNPMIALKAINFFGEIDENIDPPKLLKALKISQIAKRIQEATKYPNKTF